MEADQDYTQAVHAFLRDLLERLRGRRFDFERWHRFQADADEALALLRWAALCDGILPDLGQDRLHLLEARHPLLLPGVRAALDLEPLDHEAVPLTLELDRERPGVVISGSNTGGKTVVLKTVGLLTALARAGLRHPRPAGTEVPELATLHADIGDHQTLVGSLSTFSSHILHLKQIIAQARRGGLVLLDELGTGTDPKEGAALGIALLQALSRRQCWVLCSTHLGEISQWALRHPRFQNASVQFDEERLAPTYRLLVGMPGQSRALTIAAKLGLPRVHPGPRREGPGPARAGLARVPAPAGGRPPAGAGARPRRWSSDGRPAGEGPADPGPAGGGPARPAGPVPARVPGEGPAGAGLPGPRGQAAGEGAEGEAEGRPGNQPRPGGHRGPGADPHHGADRPGRAAAPARPAPPGPGPARSSRRAASPATGGWAWRAGSPP